MCLEKLNGDSTKLMPGVNSASDFRRITFDLRKLINFEYLTNLLKLLHYQNKSIFNSLSRSRYFHFYKERWLAFLGCLCAKHCANALFINYTLSASQLAR